MRRTLAAAMATVMLASLAPMVRPAEQLEELETVLVTGDQPGPGLWKVSRGDNVLWVLGSNRLVPARATWRAQHVQDRIAESQEVIYPPEVEVYPSISILRILTLLPFALSLDENPGGKRLDEVLPPELYARWRALRDKYVIIRDEKFRKKFLKGMEERRPGLVAMELRSFAILSGGVRQGGVDRLVQATAKEHMVPVRRLPRLNRAVKVENPGRLLKDARNKVQQTELACFVRTLDKLEADIESARVRANAWAQGDLTKLRGLPRDFQPRSDDCLYAMVAGYTEQDGKNAAKAKKILADFEWHEEQGLVQAQRDWVAAVQLALQKNRSTFAVLPIDDVLRADGHVETLRALGYTVEDPL